MGKNIVVLGTQWGDEGKGKIVDLLTDQVALYASRADIMPGIRSLLRVIKQYYI